jgi:DNA-binding IscR family transcriptional regulator
VESVRGAHGGYRLKRPASQIFLSEVMRTIDGPLAPFGDAALLQNLIDTDKSHRALYKVFLQVRDAAAMILEHTSVAEIAGTDVNASARPKKPKSKSNSRK